MEDCNVHSETAVPSVLPSRRFDPTTIHLSTTLSQRRSVQDVIDSMKKDVAVGSPTSVVAWHHEPRDCPQCVAEGTTPRARRLFKLGLHDGRPRLFIGQVGRTKRRSTNPRDGVEPSPQTYVSGDTYSLCGIVYSTMGGLHYVSQVFLPSSKCWVKYNDMDSSEAAHAHYFDPSYYKGSEYLLLYVRTDLLKRMGCHHASTEQQLDADNPGRVGATSTTSVDVDTGREDISPPAAVGINTGSGVSSSPIEVNADTDSAEELTPTDADVSTGSVGASHSGNGLHHRVILIGAKRSADKISASPSMGPSALQVNMYI